MTIYPQVASSIKQTWIVVERSLVARKRSTFCKSTRSVPADNEVHMLYRINPTALIRIGLFFLQELKISLGRVDVSAR